MQYISIKKYDNPTHKSINNKKIMKHKGNCIWCQKLFEAPNPKIQPFRNSVLQRGYCHV